MNLNGRVAIVTGANSGIGQAIAERFAEAGAAVCVNYLKQAQVAEGLIGRLPRAIAIQADVSRAAEVRTLVHRTVQELGGVDILVNNAAVQRPGGLLDLDEASWDDVMTVNLKGPFLCMQACARVMRDTGRGGSIVNISSIHEDMPFPGFTPYCVAKGGLRMLMRNSALELAPHRIRVNNIAPGPIATPGNEARFVDTQLMAALHRVVPLGRLGEMREVAELALFLASHASSYVTGSTYYVDGGMARYAETV